MRFKRMFPFILVLIITAPSFIRLLNGNYFSMHDDQHIARLFLLDEGIRQGSLYPRWVGGLGFNFGYPLFNFYPPLIYYTAELFHLIGFSLIWSIKLVFITGFILAAWGIYLFAKRYIGAVFAYLASALYTFFFYHAVLIYVRGALAEFFTLATFPFILLSLDNLYRKPNLRNSVFFAIAFALLVLNHPLVAFPSLIFIGLFFAYLFLIKRPGRLDFLKFGILGLLIGLSLSSFFWLPSMAERKFTLVDDILTKELANYKIHYVYPTQFLYSPWGFGGSIDGPYDGVTFQLGKIHIFLTIASLFLSLLYLLKTKKADGHFKNFIFFFSILFFSLFMTTNYSSFIWDNLKYLWYLQFPWRFLTFAAFFISITGAYFLFFVYKLSNKKISTTLLVVFILATVGIYQKYFSPQDYLKISDKDKTSFEEISWRISSTSFEFIPKGVKTKKSRFNTTIPDIDKKDLPKQPYLITSGKAKVEIIQNKFQEKSFEIVAQEPLVFRLNTYSFPGWNAYLLNGKKIKISDNNDLKLITVNVPKGKQVLVFKFEDTPVRKAGNIASLISLVAVFSYLVSSKRKKAD